MFTNIASSFLFLKGIDYILVLVGILVVLKTL